MSDLGTAERSRTVAQEGGQSSRAGWRTGPTAGTSSARRPALRRWLVFTDLAMVLPAWLVAALGPWAPAEVPARWWAAVPGISLATMALLALAGLYRARVCSVRSIEVARLAYVSMAVGLLTNLVSTRFVDRSITGVVVAGTAAAFLTLLAGRALYRNWLLAQRAAGRLLRTVAIVGADDEASRLGAHLEEHPELGYDVAGFFRSAEGHAAHLARPVLGLVDEAPTVVRQLDLSGAVVVPGALLPSELDFVLRSLAEAKVHVHLATGLRGIDSRRLRSLPMGHEPLLYLEPPGMHAPWYGGLKRVIDVVGACAALVLAAPLLLVAAVAIKLSDGGPVLFRQPRAGKDGQSFSVWKLRSMTIDAEERLADLLTQNQRQGPLFKLDGDPRVTRVGAVLRATSLDEVPQLFNVLRGDMSLVGPRPALLGELAAFDDELLVRQQVRPGVTGLWQVEARDNPSFAAYCYLDVFYVENQSLALDLTILLATVRAVMSSCAHAVRQHRRRRRTAEVAAMPIVDVDVELDLRTTEVAS